MTPQVKAVIVKKKKVQLQKERKIGLDLIVL